MKLSIDGGIDKSPETRAFWLVWGMFALTLLAWPLAAFGVGFAFDAPLTGPLDTMFRYSIVFAVWLYPIFMLAGYYLSWRARRQGQGLTMSLRPTILPLLPVFYLGILWLGAMAYELATT